MRTLLNALSLPLRCSFRDGVGEELHKLSNGSTLVEREAGEVGCTTQDCGGLVWGSEDNGDGEDLHGISVEVKDGIAWCRPR